MNHLYTISAIVRWLPFPQTTYRSSRSSHLSIVFNIPRLIISLNFSPPPCAFPPFNTSRVSEFLDLWSNVNIMVGFTFVPLVAMTSLVVHTRIVPSSDLEVTSRVGNRLETYAQSIHTNTKRYLLCYLYVCKETYLFLLSSLLGFRPCPCP